VGDENVEMDRPARIVLVGMMGSGKTTVGRQLAVELGWPMLDNDALVLAATGRDGPTIFRDAGEDALHGAERAAFVAGVDRSPPAVLTVAGSVVDDAALLTRLRASGRVVWLRAAPATLRERIDRGAGRRADAVDEAWLASRAADRSALYQSVADQIVDVDGRTVPEIVTAILERAGLSREPSAG
jgi:shikimate kinase